LKRKGNGTLEISRNGQMKMFISKNFLRRLSALTVKSIRTAIDVSHPYATLIKRGLKIPPPSINRSISKFDRARVIPIGDGLGRVLAEIIRYVKRFYNSEAVPACDHWDVQRSGLALRRRIWSQGIRHPSAAGIQTIRARIREVSITAEGRRSDGSPLVLLPHDCRRVFASEHLNNNTPVHITQALLGHASPDTVMIYAKLYPNQLIEEYRKTVRSLYNVYYGEDGVKTRKNGPPSRRAAASATWARISAPCPLENSVQRDWSASARRMPKEKCGAGVSAHAGQQPDGCARSQRTCRTDCGPRDGDYQDQGSGSV
jgi:integrase